MKLSIPQIAFSFVFIFLLLGGCFTMEGTYTKIPPGPWRGVLKLDREKALAKSVVHETDARYQPPFEEVTEGDLPFNFEVVYTSKDDFYIEIKNGDERIRLDEISFKHNRATNQDTIIIDFPPYDSYIKAIFEDNVIEGKWVVPSRGNYEVHFIAMHGQNHRFTHLAKEPIMDISGNWAVHFEVETENPTPAIGQFVQNGNHLTGTFMTETGDYRFLEGTIQRNKIYLSCFDGAHMFLFEGLIAEDGSISGIFRNGTHYITGWEAVRSDSFELQHPDSLTFLLPDNDRFNFSFPDENNHQISLDDEVFIGRPKIIQILGTWCPNCVDETRFLVDYLKQKEPDIAVIGLAFERHDDPSKAKSSIARFRKKLNVPYPILYAGPSDKSEAIKQLPMLNQIISYPTLIFINRNDEVTRIHTGFSGPATSEYDTFKDDFEQSVKALLDSQ